MLHREIKWETWVFSGGARIAGFALLFAALGAFGQTTSSCFPLAEVPGPGGGGLDGGGVTRVPGSSFRIFLNDCGQSVAYTTLWLPGGQTTNSLAVVGPPAGVTQTYTVRTSSAAQVKTGSISISGAAAGTPVCTMSVPTTAPVVGQTVQLTANCSPLPTTYSWSGSTSNIALVSGQNTPQATYTFLTATSGGFYALYMDPFNAAGRGGPIAASFTVSGAPVAVPSAVPIAPGAYHSCALIVTGGVQCWGRNDIGEIGDGTTSGRSFPAAVVGLGSGVNAVTSGSFHTCALMANGGAKCWGSGLSGALGDGTTVQVAATPVNVQGFPGEAAGSLTAIAAGYEHTCAIASDTRVWCWGKNDVGQLGSATSPGANAPVGTPVVTGPAPNNAYLMGSIALAMGQNHGCALSTSGGVKCWGDNQVGQIGNGSVNPMSFPADVVGLASGVRAIAANGYHSCALTAAGGVKCWGRNADGRLGDGTTTDRRTPVDVVGLSSGVTAIAVGGNNSCALLATGNVLCWGGNGHGQLGDGTTTDRILPVKVVGLPPGIKSISGGGFFNSALANDGAVYQWGDNSFGQVGDGTLFDRIAPRAVIGTNGTGYLSLTNQIPTVSPQQAPAIPVSVTGSVRAVVADVTVTLKPRPQDAGTNPRVFAYGLAPASLVRSLLKADVGDTGIMAKSEGKATSDACKLVQLSESGQLRGLNSASELTPFLVNALSALGSSFKLLNNVPTINIAGVTICLGYGATPDAMVTNGTSQCLLTVPSSVVCNPQPPQTGWWWNPAEGGRGYSIEVRNNKISWAAYLYDTSGRATWHVANGAMLFDGALFVGPIYKVVNGQTLSGAYRNPFATPSNLTTVGTVSLSFTDASSGKMAWPGGTVPIERMNIVPNGLSSTAAPSQPESGWWWNAEENGRGYFIEWQNGYADLAAYMYDDAGNPVWYISVAQTPNTRLFSGSWWQFGGGQTLTGAFTPGAAQKIGRAHV